MFKQTIKMIVFTLIALAFTASAAFAADGWASMAGGTTGGEGGETVTVSNATDFITYAMNSGATPYIIQVSGNINLGSSNIRVRGNKTIIGLPGSHISGNLKCYRSEESNNIFQYLDMDNEAKVGDGDCITIDDADHIWVDHCTFTDGGDGNVDIKNSADYITVSWCIFKYTFDSGHNFSNLVGHDDNNGSVDRNHLLVTFHHNWWSTMTKERMPRVRFGQVHVYNNYYSDLLAGGYCIGVGTESNIRVESNYFNAVPNPWANYSTGTQGIIGWDSDNIFYNCTIPTWAPNDYSTVFVPPYSYASDDGLSVPGIVMAGAGAGGGGEPTPTPVPTPTPTPTPVPTPTPTPTPPPGVPAAPSNLVATGASRSIVLTWTDNSSNETGFQIYRATKATGSFSLKATVGANINTWTNTGLTTGKNYWYKVRAINAAGNSAYSNVATATVE